MANFFGLGNAMVDYYFDFDSFADFPHECKAGRALHVDGAEFQRIVEAIEDAGRCTVLREAGGSVFNALKIMSQIAPKIGSANSLTFLGTACDDDDGLFFAERARCYGIDFLKSPAPQNGQTGRFAFLKAKTGETSILASPGASLRIPAAHFSAAKSACVLFEAAHLSNHELTEKAVSFCADSHVTLAFLCGTVYGAKQLAAYLEKQHENMPQVFIFANAAEGALLRDIPKVNCLYIETNGSAGGFAEDFLGSAAGKRFYYAAEKPASPPVDETGCGDAFAGAFLSHYFSAPTPAAIPASLKKAAEIAGLVTLQKLCRLET